MKVGISSTCIFSWLKIHEIDIIDVDKVRFVVDGMEVIVVGGVV